MLLLEEVLVAVVDREGKGFFWFWDIEVYDDDDDDVGNRGGADKEGKEEEDLQVIRGVFVPSDVTAKEEQGIDKDSLEVVRFSEVLIKGLDD